MYIFVGLLYSELRRKQIINEVKTSLESAANAYQWGLLLGLKKVTNEKIKIINSVPMGTFPGQSKIFREKSSLEKDNEFEIDNIGYLNLPFIKQNQRTSGLYARLKKIIENEKEEITVILYSLYHPYLKALDKLKKRYSNFQYFVIVPDLPCEYGIEVNNKVKRAFNRKVGYEALDFAKNADGYVFLTEKMNEVVNKTGRPYQIIEGIAKEGTRIDKSARWEKPVILYTGNLNRVFGIETLLDAYFKLPEDFAELWIAGAGDMQEELEELSKKNKNVKYFGYCAQEEILKMQGQAWILVNPRSGRDEYAKYSFPSKTMEYLASGKPVAMNRLPGIPQEYNEHIFFFKEETAESMAETFQEILALPKNELNERKEKQLRFIIEQKCGAVQAQKIIKLRNDCLKR